MAFRFRHGSALDRLDVWRQQVRRSLQHTEVLRECRQKGLWPPAIEPPLELAGRRVLVARGDRLGDMMLTVPFLARLRASGAQLRALTPDRPSRSLLAGAGIECSATPDDAAPFAPELVVIPSTSRYLRARRHPDRFEFVERLLATLPGTPVVAPSMRRAEAFSLFVGPCVTPRSGYTALSILEVFADRLGLPPAPTPLFAHWTSDSAIRARGAVVLNLSAGRAGHSDRRHLPVSFWSSVAQALSAHAPVAAIVQPGDRELREQAESDPVLSKGPVACFDDAADAAAWLGRQRLLVSSETGLCHLARNLSLPMVVLTPPRKVPYFYPPGPDTRFVFAKTNQSVAWQRVVAEALASLADPGR